MNEDLKFLKEALLADSDGNPANIINVEGKEKGHQCLVIFTQSKEQKESDLRTKITLTFTEV